jgi:hypothetical protein
VSIELLALGDKAVPSLKYEPVVFGQVFVASLADLWRMKARAYLADRAGERMHDLGDYKWLERQMVERAIEYDPVELLEMILDASKVRPRVVLSAHVLSCEFRYTPPEL